MDTYESEEIINRKFHRFGTGKKKTYRRVAESAERRRLQNAFM
jgi:hypothetical protein